MTNSATLATDLREVLQAAETQKNRLSRRSFLKLTSLGCGGFALAMYLPESGANVPAGATRAGQNSLNAFVNIGTNGRITIYAHNPEIGQGIKTSLPMVVAEELGAKWSDVDVLQSPIDEKTYGRHYAAARRRFRAASIRCARSAPRRERCSSVRRLRPGRVPAAECTPKTAQSCTCRSGRTVDSRQLRVGRSEAAGTGAEVAQVQGSQGLETARHPRQRRRQSRSSSRANRCSASTLSSRAWCSPRTRSAPRSTAK